MRLFLLFAYIEPTPLGGASDCAAVCADIETAYEAAWEPWGGQRRPVDLDICEVFSLDTDRPQDGLTFEAWMDAGQWRSAHEFS